MMVGWHGLPGTSDRQRRWSGLKGHLLVVALLGAVACGDSGTEPDPPGVVVDIEALFAPATAGEIAAVEADWAGRAPVAAGVQVEATTSVTLAGTPATLKVVSHLVDGIRHYGALVEPDGASEGSLPVLVYAHGGDGGVDTSELLLVAFALGELADDFVYVIPSFRSEPLVVEGETFVSGGDPSPWDRDVDDALALLDVALASTAGDAERIAVLGISRGAGVGLLMGIRDPRVDRVVEFFGPTDFFGPYVRDIFEAALAGSPPDLPGVVDLDRDFIQPLADGDLDVASVRLELVRRSPVLFVDRLPDVQIHHGTADPIVDVGQAESLIDALQAAGRGPPGDEWYIYEGGGHDPLSLIGSLQRAIAFLTDAGP